jgi:hypothetical protein
MRAGRFPVRNTSDAGVLLPDQKYNAVTLGTLLFLAQQQGFVIKE